MHFNKSLLIAFRLWLVFCGTMLLPHFAEANELPVVMLAGFQNRVPLNNPTLTGITDDINGAINSFNDEIASELSLDPRFILVGADETALRARIDEATLINQLGEGKVIPELQQQGDYIIFGYLTNVSTIKAQTGAIGIGGKDKTVHVELSMRVMDAHTGALVFVTTADSKRKAELKYHVILKRNDVGAENALAEALAIAAQNLANQFLQAM